MASSDRPGHGLQVFSAPANAVRVRRINDLVSVVFGAGVLLVLAVVASSSSELDGNWSGLAADLPGWLLWAAQATYVVSVGNAAALILGVGAFARDRLELIRDLLLAAALAGAMTIGLSHLVDARLPEVLLAGSAPATTFPALFVAVTAAIQAVWAAVCVN